MRLSPSAFIDRIFGRARGASRLIALAMTALLVGLWAAVAVHIENDRCLTEAGIRRDTASMAKLVEEHALAALRQIDEFSYRLKFFYERNGAAWDWFDVIVGKKAATAPFFRNFVVVDQDGAVVLASRPVRSEPESMRLNPEFLAQQHADELRIGMPVDDPALGRPVIPVSRRISHPDGRFGGIVLVEVEAEYFHRFYEGIGLPAGSAVILSRNDGPILARMPLNDQAVGRSVFPSMMQQARRRGPDGHFEAVSVVDGVARHYAYRFSSEYPVRTAVGFDTSEMLAPWRQRSAAYIAVGAAMTAVLVLLSWVLMRQLRRRDESEAKFRAIVDNAADGILVADASGRIRSCNDAATMMLGCPDAALHGQDVASLFPAIMEDRARWLESAAWLGKRGCALVARRADRSELPVDLTISQWCAGAERFFTVVMHDATERVRVQRELQAAKESAEEASRAKSAFLANMSHELRTPLNAVIGFADVLRSELLGPMANRRYVEYAANIHESGHHLLTLINDILDLSKAEAGHLSLSEAEVDVTALGDACARMIAGQAERGGVTLTVRTASEARWIRGDETRLRQILLNLLSNAVKFTPRGGAVVLETMLVDGEAVIAVRDTGIGIADENLDRVMEPFGQVETPLSRSIQGTGLGLPLTKRLVELHQGRMRVVSELGAGTTVTVALPASRVLRGRVDAAA